MTRSVASSTPIHLSRATSRSNTAVRPLPRPAVLDTTGTLSLSGIYAGPVYTHSVSHRLSGSVVCPFADEAIQVSAIVIDPEIPAGDLLKVTLDLGLNVDLARIEFYGNFLLPPYVEDGRPFTNFGLPRGMAVAISEDLPQQMDLHGLASSTPWLNPVTLDMKLVYQTDNFRSLAGWTPVHLKSAYGRFLHFLFWDLPKRAVGSQANAHLQNGLDIQRIVFYPFLESTDHHPTIEYAPLSSYQTRYTHQSRYWTTHDCSEPSDKNNESVFLTQEGQAQLPSSLIGMPHVTSATVPVPSFPLGSWGANSTQSVYSSDVIEPDSDDRVMLTLQATTDRIPLVSGVELLFKGPKTSGKSDGGLPDYLIQVLTTNDEEAAWSSHSAHPSWTAASVPSLVRASRGFYTNSIQLMFSNPHWARYTRLVVQVVTPDSGEELKPEDYRFQLFGLNLLRPRDFLVTPEKGEKYRIEHVVMRLRGPRLLDDYAFIDGRNGFSLSLELKTARGPFREIQSFRTLLQVLENCQCRTYANQRYIHKPIQKLHEVVHTTHKGKGSSTTNSSGINTAKILPENDNYILSESASITEHTRSPNEGAGDISEFERLSLLPVGHVETEREYPDPEEYLAELNNLISWPNTIGPPEEELADQITESIRRMINMGYPVSGSVGVNGSVSGDIGASMVATGSVGGSVGLSFSGSTQVGGGITRATVTGRQGAVVQTETRTVSSNAKSTVGSNLLSTTTQNSEVDDNRTVTRTDNSDEIRRAGVSVQYGGSVEDIILATIPVGIILEGPVGPEQDIGKKPPQTGDILRVKVDHLPQSVSLDVEFRGILEEQESGDV